MPVDRDGDPQVVAAGLVLLGVRVVEVGQQCVGALRRRHPRLVQGVQRRDPRRHRRGERLAEERAEGDVLPCLDVARGPVVEQAQPEDVLAEVAQRHRAARLGRHAHHEADLGLDVQADGRAEDGSGVGGPLALPARAHDVRPGHHDRAGPAVVADRQVLPVRGEGVGGVGAEDPADVPRVVLGGVEVDVVGDLEGEVQGHRGQGVEERFERRAVGGDRHPGGQGPPHVGPGRAAGRQQRVEGGPCEQGGVRRAQCVGRRAGVEDVVAEPDAHRPVLRAGDREHAVRKVVRAEGVALGDIEGGHRVLPRFRARHVRRARRVCHMVRGTATRYGWHTGLGQCVEWGRWVAGRVRAGLLTCGEWTGGRCGDGGRRGEDTVGRCPRGRRTPA